MEGNTNKSVDETCSNHAMVKSGWKAMSEQQHEIYAIQHGDAPPHFCKICFITANPAELHLLAAIGMIRVCFYLQHLKQTATGILTGKPCFWQKHPPGTVGLGNITLVRSQQFNLAGC